VLAPGGHSDLLGRSFPRPRMSNFSFLRPEWPEVAEAAMRAEAAVQSDARTGCFYARRALELTVHWMYKNDSALKLPYQDHLAALIHEPTFRTAVGPAVFAKTKVVKELGNQAVHSARPIRGYDALTAVRELFQICFWFARTYARGAKPADGLAFDEKQLAPVAEQKPATADQLQKLAAQLAEKDEKLSALLADKTALDEELKKLRAEVAAAKATNAARPDTHDYSEAETRDFFIDLLLKEAGWALNRTEDREYPVTGMPNKNGEGFVDYVLWGDDGRPLALVEAKRTKRDPKVGQRQAELYANCLEAKFGRRPVIFYSNGYEHWMWDDANYPPRPVQGFYKKAELELMIQRRTTRKPLATASINEAIVERYYQMRAIRRIGEAFEKDNDRKALVVMATGAGKTRTVIALCDLLMRCNWVKRVLFLADRVALVKQAVNEFKKHLPDAAPVNLVTEKDTEGRVYVSTYPTMMGLIDEASDGQRRFGVGHFDLIIIDEAHRSVYQKYRAIFAYFDALLVGLTATPRAEIDRDTYGLFDLEKGVPTDAYDLDEAVKDGFLVPMKAVSVPLKFQREGIKYDDLSDDEKEQWDALEWSEDGDVPEQVSAEAVNQWLFNQDTVDKVLEHVMTRGLKVGGGDQLGKTIIFAKNHAHAEFIAERFNVNYPHFKGQFARVIDFQTEYAQSLIDDFSSAKKAPHIAISVDMLDTGIDVPEVVNLVFFKLVRSKTKFWQMIGRGTRLCRDLFGPGKDKEFFYVFDFCQNLEFFSQNPEATGGSLSESLSARLFKARLELIGELDRPQAGVLDRHNVGVLDEGANARSDVRGDTAELLRMQVAAMNVENFIVRPQRRWVEKYAQKDAWNDLPASIAAEVGDKLAGLPTELDPEDEEAKRFDLLILNLQLALLRSEPSVERLRKQVVAIAGLLQEKAAIPMVAKEMALILDLQTTEWWQDVTTAMLESVRRRLRHLLKLIDKTARKPLYTDFEDVKGEEKTIELAGFTVPDGFERFKAKARQFLRAHEDHIAVQKVRANEPLTATDLKEIERMLIENGVGSAELIEQARAEANGLGRFVRSLVGLDRDAAKRVLGRFLEKTILTATQIEFLDLIVDHLTRHGAMAPKLLYESPFTDKSPLGPESLFESSEVDKIVAAIEEIDERAAG
jgi:type I restriction enzyme R subunit